MLITSWDCYYERIPTEVGRSKGVSCCRRSPWWCSNPPLHPELHNPCRPPCSRSLTGLRSRSSRSRLFPSLASPLVRTDGFIAVSRRRLKHTSTPPWQTLPDLTWLLHPLFEKTKIPQKMLLIPDERPAEEDCDAHCTMLESNIYFTRIQCSTVNICTASFV